ncbi:MAG: PD40 domain-containing protein [Vicinamibacteria bacterium]|nr:PD40 domain-containing protein [Vicinamibacteria bacterium]
MRTATAFTLSIVLGLTTLEAQKKPAPPPATPADDVGKRINTPRPNARTVTFEVREGTWMSVDVSPDGRTLVFDLLGDLYTLPIEGGTATAISRGPAYDHHPRFSPDGTSLAFTSDEGGMENIWLADADGTNRRPLTIEKVAYVRSAAWLPDGDYLVARRVDGKRAGLPPNELWLFHRLGGSGIKITAASDLNAATGPAGSRDGRYIYYAARRSRFSYESDLRNGLWAIVRYDRSTAERTTLTSGIGGAARPAVSPDGKTLVFISRRDAGTVLVARTLDTGAERVLARGLTHDDQEGFAAMDVWPNYAFTPDGQALVYSSRGGLHRLAMTVGATPQPIPFIAPVSIALAPTVTRQDRLPQGAVEAKILRRAQQSPDGRAIVFEAFGRVWVQALDGGRAAGVPRRLTATETPSREYTPAIAPDGQSVAFVSWSDAEGGAIWKAALGATPSAPTRLTTVAAHYANPSWSPNGDRLAVVRGSGLEFRGQQPEEEDFFELRWLPSGGGEPELVTTVGQPAGTRFHPSAAWSTDGTRLMYGRPVELKSPDDDPKVDLVSTRLDGTDKKTLLRLPPLDDLVPSPDGRWLAFTVRDQTYVTAVPPTQLEPAPEVGTKEPSVPVWLLSDAAGNYAAWADAGRSVTWTLGPVLHRVSLATAIAFAQERARKAREKEAAAPAPQAAAAGKPAEKSDEPRVPASEQIRIALTMPRPAPIGSVALIGARVVTMKGDEVLPFADLIITSNRIVAVGPSGHVAIPADARRLDAAGTTVAPGLIDTHAHLHYSGFETFPETKWEYAASLAYGVTTVYDPSAPSLDVFAQAELVEAGRMLGPRVLSSGMVLYGGQQAAFYAEVESQDDARRQVRRMKAYGARMIKVYQQPRRDQRLWFAQACREEGMLLTVEGAGELQTDMTTAVDGFTAFEHALPYELHDDVVQLLARAGTYYTPTLLVAYGGPTAEQYFYQTANPHGDQTLGRFVPHRMLDNFGRRTMWMAPDEYHFPVVARGAAAVQKAGGKVALGAHGQLQGLGVHWELWAHAGVGDTTGGSAMTPHQAWRAATRDAADKLGLLQDLGTVEAGKLADLVVLDSDPLADIRNSTTLRWVIKNGEVFEAPTLKAIWPTEKALPMMFWQRGN